MEHDELNEEIINLASKIKAIDENATLSNLKLFQGVNRKESYRKQLNIIKSSTSLFENISIYDLSSDERFTIKNHLQSIYRISYELEIARSETNVSFLKSNLDRWFSEFDQSYKVVFKYIQQLAIVEVLQNEGFLRYRKVLADINSVAEQAKKQLVSITSMREVMQSKLKEAEQTNLSINIIADELGIVKYQDIFRVQAKSFQNASKWWMLGTFLILLALIGCGIFLIRQPTIGIITPQNFVLLLSNRLIIATALFIALSFCIKGYRTSRHNQILNKHRENAISSFHDFIKTVKDDEATKNAILLEVTKTIFANQSTGYTSADNEVEGSSKIIEIIRNIPKQTP